jgi:hypothetical protein
MASGHERDGARGERIKAFVRSAYAYRVLRLSGALVVVSLWLTMAFGDPSFLIILLATVPGVWWWRRSLSREETGDELL